MKAATTINEVREIVTQWKKEGKSIGLVPTMGFLHEGHGSLIKKAVEQNDRVVVSDFVNPTQFGPDEDLEAYPRDFDADKFYAESLGADLIFHPEPSEMYHDQCTYVNIDKLSDHLCGAKRPIHFKGVCTVCSKLFNIVTPDRVYYGQKDAQQLAIIKKMVLDMNFPLEVIGCPIVREEDGLAKSSRNTYLSEEERKAALCLSKAIFTAEKATEKGMNSADIIKIIKDIISKEPLAKIDYIEVVDLLDMQPVTKVENDILVAIAVYIGKTRLIDNFIFEC